MLVPDDIQKCVCFVYVHAAGQFRPVGTAFFMSTPWWDTADGKVIFPGQYLVTALHVVARAEQVSEDGCLSLRINTVKGESAFVTVPLERWIKADQCSGAVDVAILEWQPYAVAQVGLDALEFASIRTNSCATGENIGVDIGVGGDLFLPGLFVSHVGQERTSRSSAQGRSRCCPATRWRRQWARCRPTSSKHAPSAALADRRSSRSWSHTPPFPHFSLAISPPTSRRVERLVGRASRVR